MANSTLMHTGETPPSTHKGHGTADLGPSDSTDSGSDVRGGPGFQREERMGLTPGPASGSEVEGVVEGAGPDIGDTDLDSDSDRAGTGERGAAGRDTAGPVDQTLYDDEGNAISGEDIADDSALDTTLDSLREEGAEIEEDQSGERIEREGELSERVGASDVERDVPVLDRAHRDTSV
ncbi:MAG TPA: hypothetical protein VNE58_05765 [Casimicrobiaceae bacterium]|nr:hypothetical protein [Casimicrobiaceae bacterium]